MEISSLLVVSLTIFTMLCELEAQGSLTLKKLHQDLLTGYNPMVRPAQNRSEPVYVQMNFKLQQVVRVNFDEGAIETKYALEHVWYDHQLEWNPKSYDEITEIQLPPNVIWHPDIIILNEITHDEKYLESQTLNPSLARVHRSGRVSVSTSVLSKTYCAFDTSRFLFGRQYCWIKFIPGTNDGLLVDLRLKPQPVPVEHILDEEMKWKDGAEFDKEYFVENPEWKVSRLSAERHENQTCCKNPFVDVIVTFNLKRPSGLFVTTLVLPWMIFTFLAPFAFILPAHSTMRLLYTVVFLLVLITTYVSSPLFLNMSKCYNFTTIIAVLVLIINSIFMRLRERNDATPESVLRFIDKVSHYISIGCHESTSGADSQAVEPTSTTRLNEVEVDQQKRNWKDTVHILDNFSFASFSVIIAVGVFSILGSGV